MKDIKINGNVKNSVLFFVYLKDNVCKVNKATAKWQVGFAEVSLWDVISCFFCILDAYMCHVCRKKKKDKTKVV